MFLILRAFSTQSYVIIACSVFIMVPADKWILSESKSELIPALTSFHGCWPWSHQHCLSSSCSPVLPICLRLRWMSDVLLSSEGWKEMPGPVSWPLCLGWCQPPVISGLSLHLFIYHLSSVFVSWCPFQLVAEDLGKVIPAFFASRLDECASLDGVLEQLVQNAAACLLTGTQKRDLITPFWPSSMASSQFQHWLPSLLPPFVLLPQN